MRTALLTRSIVIAATVAVLAATGFAAADLVAAPAAASSANPMKTCSSGYVHAIIGGEEKCLHSGEYCSAQYEAQYEQYGFRCVNGRLETGGTTTPTTTTAPSTTTAPTTTAAPESTSSSTTTATTTSPTTTQPNRPPLGRTVLLRHRTRTANCKLSALPDRRCSPGAYYSRLTKSVICSASFRTSSIRNVPDSEKHAVEVEYGLAPKSYGFTLEIDHIVSLELGGSNDIANLYPEKASFANGSPASASKTSLRTACTTWCAQARLASARRSSKSP